MNSNPAPINAKAAAAVMAIFLLLAAVFGAPVGSATSGPDHEVVSLEVDGQ